MNNKHISMPREAVESMQDNLTRRGQEFLASYGLIGAILLLGGAGFVADRYLGTGPWCLLGGLLAGLCAGFYLIVRSIQH